MAKKSAMSKGYRKTAKVKPFLTKKEIIALIVIVAAILVGLLLFNIFYDDGYMDAEEVQANDMVYYASSDLRDRYIKLGTANEVEGFTISSSGDNTNGVLLRRDYTPEAPTDNIDYFTVSGSFVNASTLAATNYAYLTSEELELTVTDMQEMEIQGYPAYVFSYQENPAEEGAEETEDQDPGLTQGISTFIEVDDERTVCMYIYMNHEDESTFVPAEQIQEYVEKYSVAFTLEQEEA